MLLTPKADPQMASLTMTNHLVGSFTCPLNPIFGSIREQIKYLCCLLEVQGFISLCDCFMQRPAGRASYIKYTRSQETNLRFSVKICLANPTSLFLYSRKELRFLCNKAVFNIAPLPLSERCGFCEGGRAAAEVLRLYKIETAELG